MKLLITIVIFLLSHSLKACGNEYGYTLDGKILHTGLFFLSDYHRTFDKIEIRKRLHRLRSITNGGTDFKVQSDIAWNLAKLGEVDEALGILEKLYAEHPNEYIINANLGTCYELKGKLSLALKHIKKGYELNNESHLGSEWVHIKILEAKIKNQSNPRWLSSNRIISVEDILEHGVPGPGINQGSDVELQIRTRIAFTPAPNPVIENLLLTLAEYNEEHGTYENAIMSYIYAMEFTTTRKEFIARKIRELNEHRIESGIDELPYIFKRMIENGKIDPTLMLLSVNDVANELQENHDQTIAYVDSIEDLQHTIDSLRNRSPEVHEKHTVHNEKSSGTLWGIIFGISGLLIGMGIMFILRKK